MRRADKPQIGGTHANGGLGVEGKESELSYKWGRQHFKAAKGNDDLERWRVYERNKKGERN